jgi:hypothetical protein
MQITKTNAKLAKTGALSSVPASITSAYLGQTFRQSLQQHFFLQTVSCLPAWTNGVSLWPDLLEINAGIFFRKHNMTK